MDLNALRIYLLVAESASFTRAAERLGLTRARVSAVVQQLEAELGTRLLARTTRSVRVTPDGQLFAERAQALLLDSEELQALFQRQPAALRGRLRVDMPGQLASQVLIPRLPEFLSAHPQIELELSSTDRRVDLVHEGFDCVIRAGSLRESGLVARPLGCMPQINVASPAYLATYGVPRSLEDLAQHRLVRYSSTLAGAVQGWEYTQDGEPRMLPMAAVLTVNNTVAYEAACLAGLGLIQAPAQGLGEWLKQGALVEVLPEHRAEPLPVTLLYAHRRQVARRVQAFMDWVAGVLGEVLAPP
ncbi:LysR family transcriptional regulator [Xenophilus arseniciresistens]|uniref:LysR family transcriptional regulator n=1 Tax=Xenophilus arseniciresistens TaxID=1283306 RepID=A0AAE3SZT4_9BURK|nr:LysR family transcriptional regulator [Xenophilus arseniciresistens]MDA7415582.1 LysR family transcriptional regulator [Xenophilus arseniciresistens]